jgi:hypothetical protein
MNLKQRASWGVLISTLALWCPPVLQAQSVDIGGFAGLDYYLNDKSTYSTSVSDAGFPPGILPVRGVLGFEGSMPVSDHWSLGLRIQLLALSGDGSADDGTDVTFSSLSTASSIFVAYGKSPYVEASLGYNDGSPMSSALNIADISGLTAGLRVGWYGFYLFAEEILSENLFQTPECRVGIGYELMGEISNGATHLLLNGRPIQ